MNEEILNVTILNTYIHNIFLSETLLQNIQVCGEISEFKISKGYAYFTIKDENSQINCTCFNILKTYVPKVGESVLLKGSVGYYVKGGRLNFNVTDIKPLGNGYLSIMFEQLKRKLLADGYFDDSHKKPIPQYANNVCIITSANGAAIKDIITTVKKRNNLLNLVVKDVRVQGINCASDVISALKEVDKLNFDIIVIARGGGSFEDLNGFNDENLVYAIYEAKTPIISAVGHETDFTLCDFVSDMRCPTPTAAGQLIAFDQSKLLDKLQNTKVLLWTYLNNNINNSKNILELKFNKINNLINNLLNINYMNLKEYYNILNNLIDNKITDKIIVLKELMAKISMNNLENMLKKGFWQVYNNNKIINNIDNVKIGDIINLKSIKGEIVANVTGVKNEV